MIMILKFQILYDQSGAIVMNTAVDRCLITGMLGDRGDKRWKDYVAVVGV